MRKQKRAEPKPRYSLPNNTLYLFRDIAREYPILAVFLIGDILLSIALPLVSLYLPKLAVDLAAARAESGRIVLLLGGFSLVLTLLYAARGYMNQGKYMYYNRMRQFYMRRLFDQSLVCDYRQIDSGEGQDKFQRALQTLYRGDQSGTSRLVTATTSFLVAAASFLLYSSLLAFLNPAVIAFLILLSLVNFFSVRRAQTFEQSLKDEEARLSRKLRYLDNAANDQKLGKDVRLYGMAGLLLSLRETLLTLYVALTARIRTRYFAAGIVNALTLLLRDGLAYGYLIYSVAAGRISPGDFVLYFGAITGFSGFVSAIVNSLNELNGANLQMNDLRAFLDNTDEPEPDDPAPLPETASFAVEFRDVRFSYGNGDAPPVLSGLSFTLRAGEKLALVGVNGAGKTTIIKLLCGFYRPTGGDILLNGLPISRYRKKDLYTLFSAVFQDMYLPPYTVAEGVSLRPADQTDMARVNDCLARAGLAERIARAPDGVDSYMGRSVTEGVVLSGGEQQKLLMARALYKDAPILILDEPTAALDPIAESGVYESFHRLTADKTAVYISHRLASTRFCDRILLLKDGRVWETGTHEELMRKGGEYARMFDIQSHYYRKEAASDAFA